MAFDVNFSSAKPGWGLLPLPSDTTTKTTTEKATDSAETSFDRFNQLVSDATGMNSSIEPVYDFLEDLKEKGSSQEILKMIRHALSTKYQPDNWDCWENPIKEKLNQWLINNIVSLFPDENDRIEIAFQMMDEAALGKVGELERFISVIGLFKIQNQAKLIELARNGNIPPFVLHRHFKEFGILKEEDRFKIVNARVDGFYPDIHNFDLSLDHRILLLKRLIEAGGPSAQCFPGYDIPLKNRFESVKAIVNTDDYWQIFYDRIPVLMSKRIPKLAKFLISRFTNGDELSMHPGLSTTAFSFVSYLKVQKLPKDKWIEILETLLKLYKETTPETFHRYFAKVKEIKDPALRQNMLEIIIEFTATCDMLGIEEEERKSCWKVIDQMMDMQVPALRRPLMAKLLEHLVDRSDEARQKELGSLSECLEKLFHVNGTKVDDVHIFKLLMFSFPALLNDHSKLKVVIAKMMSKKIRDDFVKRKVVISCLNTLASTSELSDEEKKNLIFMAFSHVKIDDVMGALKAIEAIINLGCAAELKKFDSKKISFERMLEKVFTEKIEIKDVEKLAEKIADNITSQRGGKALFQLLSSIEKMGNESERKMAKHHFIGIVRQILEGRQSFKQFRDSVKTAHTDVVFCDQEFAKKWLAGAQETVSVEATKSKEYTVEQRIIYLKQKIGDDHLLGAISEDQVEMIEDNLLNPSYIESDLKRLNEFPLNGEAAVKRDLINLYINLANPKLTTKEALELIQKTLPRIQKGLKGNPAFDDCWNDLNGLERLLGGKGAGEGSIYTIVETDDWNHMVLCGESLAGSCLAPTGVNARCLLANLSDPKIRMVAILDSQGKIVARRMLKVLVDEKTKEKMILRERSYIAGGVSGDLIDKMDAFIARRAKDLKCGLVSYENGPMDNYVVGVSLGSPVIGFEYSDAGDLGVVPVPDDPTQPQYKIPNLRVLQAKGT